MAENLDSLRRLGGFDALRAGHFSRKNNNHYAVQLIINH
jgi:hypothetical protein